MPPPEDASYYETAVLWRTAGKDRFNKPRVHSPIQIQCRWEQVQQPLFDPQARPIQYDAIVYTDEDIPRDSILWLGELADFHGTRLSDLDDRVMIVQTREFMKDIKGSVTQQYYRCRRYMDAIPTVID